MVERHANPYLWSKSNQPNLSAVAKNSQHESSMQRVKVLASSSWPEPDDDGEESPPSPDYDDEEYEDDELAVVGGNSSKLDDDLVPDISGDFWS